MSEHPADVEQWHASGQQGGGTGMTQGVELHVQHTGCLQQGREDVADHVRVEQAPVSVVNTRSPR